MWKKAGPKINHTFGLFSLKISVMNDQSKIAIMGLLYLLQSDTLETIEKVLEAEMAPSLPNQQRPCPLVLPSLN